MSIPIVDSGSDLAAHVGEEVALQGRFDGCYMRYAPTRENPTAEPKLLAVLALPDGSRVAFGTDLVGYLDETDDILGDVTGTVADEVAAGRGGRLRLLTNAKVTGVGAPRHETTGVVTELNGKGYTVVANAWAYHSLVNPLRFAVGDVVVLTGVAMGGNLTAAPLTMVEVAPAVGHELYADLTADELAAVGQMLLGHRDDMSAEEIVTAVLLATRGGAQ